MALTTPNMGFRIWDKLLDPYDHDQQADNWSKVDFHDHTPGRGIPVPAEGLADGAITTAKVASSFLQTFTASVPNTATASFADITVTWGTPFADTNYLIFATLRNPTAITGALTTVVTSKTTSGAVIRVYNSSGAAFNSGFINVLGVHQ